MKNEESKLPEFDSVDEEVEFWENHDVTNFLDELEDLEDVEYKEQKDRVVSLRLPEEFVEGIKSYAKEQGIPYTKLMRKWITESFQQAIRTPGRKTEGNYYGGTIPAIEEGGFGKRFGGTSEAQPEITPGASGYLEKDENGKKLATFE